MKEKELIEKIRGWAEEYPSWLSHGTPYAKGYKDAMYFAHEAICTMIAEYDKAN